MKLNKCKCDRCHNEYESKEDRKVRLRFEKEPEVGTFYFYHGGLIADERGGLLDLCDACIESLERWFNIRSFYFDR